MKFPVFVPAVLLVFAIAPTSEALPCNGNVISVGGAAYVDDRGAGNVWIYVESNGVPGLQSGGWQPIFGYIDDCGYGSYADTLIY